MVNNSIHGRGEKKKSDPRLTHCRILYRAAYDWKMHYTLPMGVQGPPYRRVSCAGIKMPATKFWQVSLLHN